MEFLHKQPLDMFYSSLYLHNNYHMGTFCIFVHTNI